MKTVHIIDRVLNLQDHSFDPSWISWVADKGPGLISKLLFRQRQVSLENEWKRIPFAIDLSFRLYINMDAQNTSRIGILDLYWLSRECQLLTAVLIPFRLKLACTCFCLYGIAWAFLNFCIWPNWGIACKRAHIPFLLYLTMFCTAGSGDLFFFQDLGFLVTAFVLILYAVTSYRDTLWPFLGLELEGWNGGSVSTFKLLAAISLNNICPLYFVTSRLHVGSTASAPTRCKKGKNAQLTSNSEVSPGKQRETFTWDNVFFIAKYCGNC